MKEVAKLAEERRRLASFHEIYQNRLVPGWHHSNESWLLALNSYPVNNLINSPFDPPDTMNWQEKSLSMARGIMISYLIFSRQANFYTNL